MKSSFVIGVLSKVSRHLLTSPWEPWNAMLGVNKEQDVRDSELNQVLPFRRSHGCVAASMHRLTQLRVRDSESV